MPFGWFEALGALPSNSALQRTGAVEIGTPATERGR